VAGVALHPFGPLREELPAVFNPKARPWVSLDEAHPNLIAETVIQCPSGALSYRLLENRDGESS